MNVLPNKYVPFSDCVIGRAARLLQLREANQTVNALWNLTRDDNSEMMFSEFCKALTLLFAMGAVDIVSGLLKWNG